MCPLIALNNTLNRLTPPLIIDWHPLTSHLTVGQELTRDWCIDTWPTIDQLLQCLLGYQSRVSINTQPWMPLQHMIPYLHSLISERISFHYLVLSPWIFRSNQCLISSFNLAIYYYTQDDEEMENHPHVIISICGNKIVEIVCLVLLSEMFLLTIYSQLDFSPKTNNRF